jgi:hypothetical protein
MNAESFQNILDNAVKKLESSMDKKLKVQEKNIENMLAEKVLKVEKQVDVLEGKMAAVEKELSENKDIAKRLCNLQLNPVPFREKENLTAIFAALSSKLGYENPPEVRIRRYKGDDDNKRPISITFPTEFHKLEFLKRFKSRASEMILSIFPGFSDDSTRVYVQHDFTSNQYRLHKAAMKFHKEGSVSKVIVEMGNRIMIQVSPDAKLTCFPDVAALEAAINRRKMSVEPSQ